MFLLREKVMGSQGSVPLWLKSNVLEFTFLEDVLLCFFVGTSKAMSKRTSLHVIKSARVLMKSGAFQLLAKYIRYYIPFSRVQLFS